MVPFSFGLATLSFYKKAAVVYRQEPEAVLPPPRWISTVGNLICILAGLPLIPLVFVILLKVVEITLRKAGIPP
ncbi:MAG TPA: hypothetical protein VJ600_03095 [Holophagaceae bacterium]|nr:hypothetical protein [Holophagaceae bacterium]